MDTNLNTDLLRAIELINHSCWTYETTWGLPFDEEEADKLASDMSGKVYTESDFDLSDIANIHLESKDMHEFATRISKGIHINNTSDVIFRID